MVTHLEERRCPPPALFLIVKMLLTNGRGLFTVVVVEINGGNGEA